ncbi:hypothetical protein PFISCL1PPCAC_4759, partial [Pristionchus fissidentatus]
VFSRSNSSRACRSKKSGTSRLACPHYYGLFPPEVPESWDPPKTNKYGVFGNVDLSAFGFVTGMPLVLKVDGRRLSRGILPEVSSQDIQTHTSVCTSIPFLLPI